MQLSMKWIVGGRSSRSNRRRVQLRSTKDCVAVEEVEARKGRRAATGIQL